MSGMAVFPRIFRHCGLTSSDRHVSNEDDNKNNDKQYPT